MAANQTSARWPARVWLLAPAFVALPTGLITAASWWFTEPIERTPPVEDRAATHIAPTRVRGEGAGPTHETPPKTEALPEWPEDRMEGPSAKRYLLSFMEQAVGRLDRVPGYTASLTRQERIDGELGVEQRLRIKIQHEPFAVYLRFESPRPGKEALYHEGRFDDHLLAHNGDWTRRFIPRLKVDPYGPIALADNRHPITEAGLAHLSRKLLYFRQLDLDDPQAETVLERTTDEDGRLWYRSLHSHSVYTDTRPFAYVEIRYCPELLLPLHIVSYDWPESGDEGQDDGTLELAERYHYDEVDLETTFSAIDFDPTNPDYGFQRY